MTCLCRAETWRNSKDHVRPRPDRQTRTGHNWPHPASAHVSSTARSGPITTGLSAPHQSSARPPQALQNKTRRSRSHLCRPQPPEHDSSDQSPSQRYVPRLSRTALTPNVASSRNLLRTLRKLQDLPANLLNLIAHPECFRHRSCSRQSIACPAELSHHSFTGPIFVGR